MIKYIEWQDKGSDYTIFMIGTRDNFKIQGILTSEMESFCKDYAAIGMVRSLPLLMKIGQKIGKINE